jgi:hypothetical protein
MAVAPGTPPPSQPAWVMRLPVSPRTGRRMVCCDNNAVSNFLFEAARDDVRFVFTSPTVEVHISRQVIDEALNHPDLAVASRQQAWNTLAQLQEAGQLVLSGVTQMLPAQQKTYHALQQQLKVSGLSGTDAFVVADAVVKRIPLLTLEENMPTGLDNALRNIKVRKILTGAGLPTGIADILVA